MGTPHNNASIGEIAKNVIMPGDPNRAKRIAEKYLSNYKLVNDVRGIYAFTGTYKGKEVTVMASGMGIPSMGLYCYELFKFYDVDNIIRIGSCGANTPDLNLFDIILTTEVYSESNFALTFGNEDVHFVKPSDELNNKIILASQKENINLAIGHTLCTDVFDEYIIDYDKYLSRIPADFNPLATEMEAFALLYTAKRLNKNATCLMTVVDSIYKENHATSNEREQGLDRMITLALESI
jgi:purine-nucleoside phosphorylase